MTQTDNGHMSPDPSTPDTNGILPRARAVEPETCEAGKDGAESDSTTPERTECPRTHCESGECEQASSVEGVNPGASQEAGRRKTTLIAGLTDNQRAFLAGYIVTGTVSGGARAAAVHRDRHYTWLQEDDDYRKAFEHAVEEAADNTEEEARRRAFGGMRKYKFLKDGSPVLHPHTGEPYYEDVYSDTLILAILRALRPTKYRDNVSVEHSSGPVPIVEDENWYGNNAHQSAETAPAPSPDPAEPGPV